MPTPDYDALVKLLLLGDSAVGKSSLLLRFADGKFDRNHVLTIGVDFKSKTIQVEDEKIKVQIWDTAGQERFRNITPVFFRSSMGIALVYDITCRSSFENVSYWMKTLSDYTDSNIPKMLIANKTDLDASRKVTSKEGKLLAQQYGIPFIETSALKDESVTEAFVLLTKTIRDQQRGSTTTKQAGMKLHPSKGLSIGACCGT